MKGWNVRMAITIFSTVANIVTRLTTALKDGKLQERYVRKMMEIWQPLTITNKVTISYQETSPVFGFLKKFQKQFIRS